jgi:hypothetical protein
VICLPQQDKHALATHALALVLARDAFVVAVACHNKTSPRYDTSFESITSRRGAVLAITSSPPHLITS